MCENGVHAIFCLVVELTDVWSVSASPCLPSVTLDIAAERENRDETFAWQCNV